MELIVLKEENGLNRWMNTPICVMTCECHVCTRSSACAFVERLATNPSLRAHSRVVSEPLLWSSYIMLM